jgi:hypothetical protein
MANPTTNYGFVLPTSSDLVTDLPADFDVALQGVDTRLKALNPETTLGDISYASATANTNTRLGIGSTGNVLTVSGGVPVWSAPAAAGSTLLDVRTGNLGSNFSTTSTSFVDVSAGNFYLTFTVPASGKVVLRVSQNIEFASTSQQAFMNWREGSTDITGSDFMMTNNANTNPLAGMVSWSCYLTGLSAGTKTYKLGMRSGGGSTFFGYTNSSRYTLEAWSA